MFFFWCQHCYFLTLFRFTTCKKPPVLTPNMISDVCFLRFLWFFTCVSWGISPAQILLIVQASAKRHYIFYFSSFSMLVQSRISKAVAICSFCSSLFFSPLYLFHPTLFYSSFYSLFCFLPLFVYFIFWSSLLFSFQICYSFFFLFLLLLPGLCSFLSFSLFSFPLFSFCFFMLPFFFCFYSFTFPILFSPLLYATSVLTVLTMFLLNDFSRLFLFIYLFFITIIFLVLFFVCIALLLLPTD